MDQRKTWSHEGTRFLSRKTDEFESLIYSGGPPPPRGFHRHDTAFFTFVTKGRVVQVDDLNRAVLAEPPFLYVTPAEMYHRHDFLDNELEGFCTILHIPVANRVQEPILVRYGEPMARMMEIAQATASRDPRSAELVPRLWARLITSLVPSSNEVGGDSDLPAWLARACDLLQSSLATGMSVEDVAREVGAHPSHLIRSFRAHLDTTPGEFARRHRLDRAKLMVQTSGLDLGTIAEECGFSDGPHFTREFKKAFGVTPSEFRRKAV